MVSTIDEEAVERIVAQTRAFNAMEKGRAAWATRRRAGLSDAANWALSVVSAGDRCYTGEELEVIVAKLLGRSL